MVEKDFQWLMDHGAEIVRQYAGKWIAVSEGKVIGVGETATEASEKARERSPNAEFILEHVLKETDVIYEHS
jgi:hypothetical protein